MNLSQIFLSGGTTTSSGGAGSVGLISTVLYLVVVIAVFYFILIRPQKKQQKQHDAMISQVERGDSVVTSSGFYGVVIDVKDDIVVVEFGSNKNCRIPMQKQAIAELEKANGETSAPAPKEEKKEKEKKLKD